MLNRLPAETRVRICLGVCTFGRPQMLHRCLTSLSRLETPPGCDVEIIVVDNHPTPIEQGIVDCFSHHGRPFHYVHERRRGIAQARNAILDKAMELRADFIAMVDDDQVAPPDWLETMWLAQQWSQADIVESSVEYDYPDALPLWAFPKSKKHRWKHSSDRAATNGVMFKAELADLGGAGLRFDEAYALTGGEDREFFWRAHRWGARIVRTPQAVITEFIPETKLTFSAQVARSYWIAVVNARQDVRFYGFIYAMLRKSFKATHSLISGLLIVVYTPFAFLGDRTYGRCQLLRGSIRIAKAAGIAVGLTGVARPEPYQTIHGG